MNAIGEIKFDFRMENKAFACSLYGQWEEFFSQHLETVFDRVLEKYDAENSVTEIERLELDLGEIEEAFFHTNFPLRLQEKLEEAIMKHLLHSHSPRQARISEQAYLFDVLCRFLLHGSLPWSITEKYRNLCTLFLEVLKNNGKQLKSFLQTYGHYSSLQRRLVYQLDDPSLEKGVRLLVPGESVFICSYFRLLKEKYKKLLQPSVRESDYRNAAWLVIYAYLLTNRSSYFNRKSFIATTIRQLATNYNLSYEHFLTLLTAQLEVLGNRETLPSDLYLILYQLKQELSEVYLVQSATNYQRWYDRIASGEKRSGTTEDKRQWEVLFSLLSHTETCRRFLRPMSDPEIIALVRIVVPRESTFVVEYAHSLDNRFQTGSLEGKVGNEFRLLKWQIIFPVLLENRSTSFNRRHFVRRTLSGIAAHYNLTLEEVLQYFFSLSHPFEADRELQQILQLLLEECMTIRQKEKRLPVAEASPDQVRSLIYTRQAISLEEIRQLTKLLASEQTILQIIRTFQEEEHARLLSLALPAESYFILPYATLLNKPSGPYGPLASAPEDFRQIKWRFIYTILFASGNQVFNQKHFVERTLRKIAAHYNRNLQELLTFFFRDSIFKEIQLPYNLIRVLEELANEYGAVPTKPISRTPAEKETEGEALRIQTAKKILQKQFGHEAAYAYLIRELSKKHEFVRLIEQVLQVAALLYDYLSVELQVHPDRKAWLELLLRLSEGFHYRTSQEIMLELFHLISSGLTKNTLSLFIQKTEELSAGIPLLEACSSGINLQKIIEMNSQSSIPLQNEQLFIENAGLVLAASFFPILFSRLSLTDHSTFKDDECRMKAIALLRYIVYGQEYASPVASYTLEKILIGMDPFEPIPELPTLMSTEKMSADQLLETIKVHWQKMKNTSLQGIQHAFLQRDGKIELTKDDYWLLTIEEKAFDVLLDSVPWNFRLIRLSWMDKMINVNWR